jgi:acyl-CoA reductase-like NAD-dependent aldehyde dehydrogenase
MASLMHKAGFPAGVVNVLSGLGPVAGARLAEHPDVRKLSFTGSTATGRRASASFRNRFMRSC